jgi:acyl-coenzyme A synthetase/AMP-(fatty) acid ligase
LNSQSHFPITSRKPEEIIAFSGGCTITVDQFIGQAKSLSRRLPRHRYVFNLHSDRYEYLLGFCASLIAGQCTLMPPNRLPRTLEDLAGIYPDSYSLSDRDFAEKTGDCAGQANEIPAIPADQLCAIAFTSGSTGLPSPNLKFWETLRTSSYGNAGILLKNISGRLNIVATVPPQHMWGLETSILLPLFANAAISDQTPFYPQDIAAALETLPEPRALVSSPVHLDILLKSGVKLARLERIFSATAPMTVELAQRLEQEYATRVLEIFGSSESGIFAGRHTAHETLWQLSDLFRLAINRDGVILEAGHLPEKVVLQDVIEMTGDRSFRWLGRQQDMLNIAGKRESLTNVNRRLLSIKGVSDGVVFKPENVGERLAALVVAPELEASDVHDELKLVLDPVFLPRPIYMVPLLPRQETGKLAIKEVNKLFEQMKKLHNPGNRKQR